MAFLGPMPLYWPFMDQCRCGKNVVELGLHGLSCTKNAGRFPRHSAINSILKSSLTRIGLPSTLEPVVLTNDGRRPDGLTLGPWSEAWAWCGTQQLWTLLLRATIKTLPDRLVLRPPEAAKCQKYHDLQSNYHFQPVAIETTCVYGKSTAPFLSGLAKKLVDVSGDPRECQWLHQRLSLAVVRGNAASILACVRVWSNFTCSFPSSCL